MTGTEIILEALLIDGVIYPGQTISTEAAAACQLGLNNLLSEWNAQGLAVFSVVRQAGFALTAGIADYTIGTGANINVTRPEKIESWAVIDASGAANAGKPIDAATFARLADDRSLQAARVDMLNYDAAFPIGTIHLYPKPSGGSLELWVWEQLAAIDFTHDIDIELPSGYLKAICYNLAVDLAPKFGRPLDPTVKGIADSTKATLGATNISEQTRTPPENRPQPARAQ